MSFNQSRANKSDGQQLRKSGRSGNFGQHRGHSGGGGGKGGGSVPSPHLSYSSSFPSSSSSHPPLSTNRSFKKSGYGQGGSSRANASTSSSEASVTAAATVTAAARALQNGLSDATVPSATKPVDAPILTNSQAHPRAPISQSAAGASDSADPATPAKGDGTETFTLQFGSISPALIDGIQIPARTTSAPPNLDEQMQDQAQHGSLRMMPKMPIHSGLKHLQQPKKDTSGANQSNTGESQPPAQVKQDVYSQISAAPAVPLPNSSVLPIAGRSIPVAFQQPRLPLQFGGPSPQMQSQGVVASSLQMPMTLPVGSVPQVPQQMFLHSLQSHHLQPQIMMHQGQGLGFTPQMSHQLPPQLGSTGIGIATAQFAQKQPGKFGSPRKTIKITHPETHEELRLDKRTDLYTDGGSAGQRPHPNVPSQSQPGPSFTTPHYYAPLQHDACNLSQMFFPTSTSLPLTSSQMPSGSQASRYSYSAGQSGQAISFMNPSVLEPMPGSKSGPPLHSLSELQKVEAMPVSAPSAPVLEVVKPVVGLHENNAGTALVTVSMPISNAEAPIILKPSGKNMISHQNDSKMSPESSVQQPKSASQPLEISEAPLSSVLVAPHGDSGPVDTGIDGGRKEPIQRSDSLKDHQKKPSKKDPRHSPHQQQADTSDSAVTVNLSSFSQGAPGDVTARQLSRKSDIVQEFSRVDTPITSFSSRGLERSSSTEVRTSKAVQIQEVPTESETSGVTLVKDIPQDDCLRADSVPLAKEKGSSETSTSSGLEMDETVTKNSYPIFSQENSILLNVELGQETVAKKENCKTEIFDDSSRDTSYSKVYPISAITGCVEGAEPVELVELDGAGGDNLESPTACESYDAERQQSGSYDEAVEQSSLVEKTPEDLSNSTSTSLDFIEAEVVPSSPLSSVNVVEKKLSSSDAITSTSKALHTHDDGLSGSDASQPETAAISTPVTPKVTEKLAEKVTKLSSEDPVSVLSSRPKDRPSLEPPRGKPSSGKKKKKKEIYSKADAAGTSDLYNAYKGPEKKQEITYISESVDSSAVADGKHVTADTDKDVVASEGDGQSKVEVDDWEDAADISTPKLRISEDGQQANQAKNDCGNETMRRKYSRDFLLTFSEQCTVLPAGFEVRSDIADALMSVSVGGSYIVDHEPYPSPGRITDRSPGASRADRRMFGILDDDKWMKASSSFASVRDLRPEIGHGASVVNFRPGQGVSHGVLRHPRGQSSSQFAGGILSGPVQSLTSQGGIPRNGADADRWQHYGTQRGLIPSPQTPAQVMHKAQNRYLVSKVTDEEEAKQRQLKAILNKLTPQNFEKLFQQVKEVNIDNAVTLTGVISQIFDKALMEPTFCEMYADFCYQLASELPDCTEGNERITFKRLLLNKCQEEFERGEREQAEANKAEEEGETEQSEVEREEKRIKTRRRMLGNIRLIGELYKKRMLTERIMHECIKKLLGQYQNPDEEDIEALCKLMSTIGEIIDHPKAKEHMDAYFDMMGKLSTNQKLSSRVRFMLRDAIDLRKNKWQQRRKVEGPKKIEEVHRDAAQERQAQASRSARGSGTSVSRRGPPADYGSRGSTILPSPSSQIGSIRNLSPPVHGYGSQDVRLSDRPPFESRTLSLPLPQRPADDDSITLGPQGGLARGMSVRAQSLMSSTTLADISPSVGDNCRVPSGPNGYSVTLDRIPYSSKEEILPKYMPDRFSGAPPDQLNRQDRNTSLGSRNKIADCSFEQSAATMHPSGHVQGSLSGSAGAPSEAKPLSEEVLREKSISAIREFYSARDEKEVSLCIKELNCPDFYPAMISFWVTDSLERKDMERDLLATLLVNLCKSQDSLLSQVQLIQGFESVLSLLEDAVNDAPRAAEFLGRIFAKIILENVVPLKDIGKLIQEGGEEPGQLLELGLASEVLGSILEVIKMEKGDAVLNQICVSSNLRLEDFRPLHPIKAKKLDAFL